MLYFLNCNSDKKFKNGCFFYIFVFFLHFLTYTCLVLSCDWYIKSPLLQHQWQPEQTSELKSCQWKEIMLFVFSVFSFFPIFWCAFNKMWVTSSFNTNEIITLWTLCSAVQPSDETFLPFEGLEVAGTVAARQAGKSE